MNEQLLLKDSEVAALLGLGRTTVWLYVSKGILPEPIKLGRSARWRRSEIEAVIAPTPQN
jgi:predicted DNA-binding transcriptional regulator AlpA